MPHLAGVIVAESSDWDDEAAVVGLLVDWIPGSALGEDIYIKARECHEKWKNQAMEIVEQLNEHDVSLGSVE